LKHTPIVGGKQEAEEEADGPVGVDLLLGRQALVEIVVDCGQEEFHARDFHLGHVLDRIETIFAKRLDYVPNVHQVYWIIFQYKVETSNDKLINTEKTDVYG